MKTILSSRRRRYVAEFSIFLIVAALITGMAGCGGSTAAIEIQDWYGLNATRDGLASNYILMNDLDSTTDGYEELAGPNANEGKGWEPLGRRWFGWMPFTGTFDGQGYEIRDLFINRADESSDIGLFGAVSKLAKTGTIKNVGAVNFTVIGSGRVGGLVGILTLGTVSNCYCTGNITGNESVGGLVGFNNPGSTVDDSYFAGSVAGEYRVGGLVGTNGHNVDNVGTVSNCYSTGNVTGDEYVGGLVGWNAGDVSDSYATGYVTGETQWVGGLIGWDSGGSVSNSFWDTETSGQATSDGGTGKNTTEMKDITTYTDTETEGLDEPWDITTVANPGTRNPSYIWNIVDDETYPFLSWQPVS